MAKDINLVIGRVIRFVDFMTTGRVDPAGSYGYQERRWQESDKVSFRVIDPKPQKVV